MENQHRWKTSTGLCFHLEEVIHVLDYSLRGWSNSVHRGANSAHKATDSVNQESTCVHQEATSVLQEANSVPQEADSVHQEATSVHQEATSVPQGANAYCMYLFKNPRTHTCSVMTDLYAKQSPPLFGL